MLLSEEQRRYLENASAEELQEIVKTVNTVMDKRADNRRKELWGNVVAAIRKYEQEVGEIDIEDEDTGRTFNLSEINAVDCGTLAIFEV